MIRVIPLAFIIATMTPWSASAAPSAEVRRVLDNFRSEPSIREVQKRAASYAAAHPAEVDSWRQRARKAYWLPELRVSLGRDQKSDINQTTTSGTGDPRATTGTDDHVEMDVRIRWELNKLVYAPTEVQLRRETVAASRQRDTLVAEVTKLYFERRRAQVRLLLDEHLDVEARVKQELKVAELTAYLDGLTGGWFSSKLKKAGR